MDANKLKVMRSVDCVINECCDLCVHAALGVSGFGQCTLRTYQHEKHTKPRFMSIHRLMSCRFFEPSHERVDAILVPSGFDKLLNRRKFTRANRHKAKTHY